MTHTPTTLPADDTVANVFPLLARPDDYVACRWDLRESEQQRAYWLGLFRRHFPTLLAEAQAECVQRGEAAEDAARRVQHCQRQFDAYLDALAQDPSCHGRLDIMSICRQREAVLRAGKFPDPYRLAKERENRLALQVLASLLTELDALPDPQRALRLVEGVFAGNIYDLGATQTQALFENGKSVDFRSVRGKLAARPWLVDDLDAWVQRITTGRAYRAAVLFVDNAGSDIVLGMIPFARDLIRRGTRVILTANTTPSLNDITCAELAAMMREIATWEPVLATALADGRLEIVPSGNGYPLIDLSDVSGELVEAVRRGPIDLVVLEGMGRGVESNFDAALSCDALKVAMIKDGRVAQEIGGKLYDLVFRFEPAGAEFGAPGPASTAVEATKGGSYNRSQSTGSARSTQSACRAKD